MAGRNKQIKIKFNLKKIERQIKDNIRKSKYLKEIGPLERSVVLYQNDRENSSEIILSAKDYFKYFDEGRPAGKFPPPAKLQEWVKHNLRVPEKDVKSLAFLIGRKIAKFGTKPRNVLKNIKYIYTYEINLEE